MAERTLTDRAFAHDTSAGATRAQYADSLIAEIALIGRTAGFGHLSLDFIYGTPRESLDDWTASLHAALELDPDHISADALPVEQLDDDAEYLERILLERRMPGRLLADAVVEVLTCDV